ncbi:AfsR/SARP family transcriptional regulator [Actinomycetes bacterium KLBMP 9797]
MSPVDDVLDRGPHEVRFRLLGPLEVVKGGKDYAPTAHKVMQLLAMLVMHPRKLVHTDLMFEELWADGPPRQARSTLQTYVYQLRRCIEQNGLAPDGEALLLTRPTGYVFQIDPMQTDVHEFQQLYGRGRAAMDAHRYGEAAAVFGTALSLWSGPPMASINCGPVLSAYAVALEEQRRNTQHLRNEAQIASGQHRDAISELRALVTANPLDEGLHAQLMRVLTLSGRRSDAMTAYRTLRARLSAELGIEPSGELQSLHHEALCAGEPRAP